MSCVVARSIFIAFLALTFACGCARKSASEVKATATPATSAAIPSQRPQDVRAYIDPATSQLRDPTPEELAAEAAEQATRKKAAATSQSEQPTSREVILPDGTVEITLDRSTQHPLHGCIQQNGDLKIDHECDAQGSEPHSASKQ
jgi:hypothetical protein